MQGILQIILTLLPCLSRSYFHFTALPSELQGEIFHYLVYQAAILRQVCRQWRQLSIKLHDPILLPLLTIGILGRVDFASLDYLFDYLPAYTFSGTHSKGRIHLIERMWPIVGCRERGDSFKEDPWERVLLVIYNYFEVIATLQPEVYMSNPLIKKNYRKVVVAQYQDMNFLFCTVYTRNDRLIRAMLFLPEILATYAEIESFIDSKMKAQLLTVAQRHPLLSVRQWAANY